MLAIPWIAVIAAGGAVLLLGLGFLIHGLVARKRHRQFMQQSEQDLRVYHRARLSVHGSNYAHVTRPPSYTTGDRGTQQTNAGWSPLKSQELIEPEVAHPAELNDSPTPAKAKRKKGLRDSIYGHSGIHAPKTRRQKKIDKTISLKDMSRSPLSAITELTDSTANEVSMPVELPTERTPNITPEKENESAISPTESVINWSLPINKRRPAPLSPVEIDTPISLKPEPSFRHTAEVPLSPTKSVMSEAPDSPLPPLPSFQPCKPSGPKRNSQMSMLTVGSSVLGPLTSSSELNLPQIVNSGMQEFDFGFDKGSTARFGPSPGKQTDWHTGSKGVASIVPAFDFLGQHVRTGSDLRAENSESDIANDNDAGWIPGPDFFFGVQRPRSASNSMQDYSLAKHGHGIASEHRKLVGSVSPAALPPRPASVASSQPFRLDQTPHLASSRLSISSTGSGRRTLGHRRQNCVRITIPVIPVSPLKRPGVMIRRPSHISEAAEDSDNEPSPSPNKEQVVDASLNNSPISPPRLSARRSIVDANGSPKVSSFTSHGVLRSNTHHSNPALSSSSSDSGSPRPDSDIFWSQPSSDIEHSKQTDPFAYPNRWALMPTLPGSMTFEPATKLSVFEQPNSEDDSPILPSPCKPAPAPANTSATRPSNAPRPLGPRQAPAFPSTNINLHRSPSKFSTKPSPTATSPGSPTRRTSLNSNPPDASTVDLRQSIALLRRMDSSGRRLNANSKLWATGATPNPNKNHEDWKQLNALWEVSRPNSVNSLSTRATPGTLTRANSTTGPGMPRKGSNPRTADADAASGMFGSSKRRMAQPHKLDLNTSTVLPPAPLSGGSRFRSGSSSPSRNSMYSVGNVSIWEDESICGDSPERNPSRRGSSAVAANRLPPPPRLESLPQLAMLQQDRRGGGPYGLGITIPSLPHHHQNPPSAVSPLGPSPTQKQLKAQYFGSVDWDKDNTNNTTNTIPSATTTTSASTYPSPTHGPSSSIEREKENIATFSSSSPFSPTFTTPPTATSTSTTMQPLSSALKSRSHRHHADAAAALDPDLALDLSLDDRHDLSLGGGSNSNYTNSSSNLPTMSYNFPLPGSSGRRKVSPAQQRLKDALRERAAGVATNTSPPLHHQLHQGPGGVGSRGFHYGQHQQNQQQQWGAGIVGTPTTTTGGGGGLVAGVGAGSAGTAKSVGLYDREGFLKDSSDSPLGMKSKNAVAAAGSGWGGMGRSYRRMQ